MESGCRFSHYWRGYELGLYTKYRICPYLAPRNYSKRPSRGSREQQLQRTIAAGFPQASFSHPNAPMVADCFSQQEDDREFPSEGSSPVAGGIVALGKFDALHIGHRELAIQASKAGSPFLLSFVGMAEVLGWERRAPIVAKCDRKRVLSSWAPYCGNVVPLEFEVEFSNVRHLTPRQFVERLSKELKVSGVVAGENYRFGYKASGDAEELVKLCKEYGLGAYIVSSIMDKNQCSSDGRSKSCDLKERGQVSSTRVRHALSEGDMKYVLELLGRRHHVVLTMDGNCFGNRNRISAPKSCLLNQPPKEGVYENCTLLVDHVYVGPCKAMIDETDIHVELDGMEGSQTWAPFQDCQLLGIEFGDTGGD